MHRTSKTVIGVTTGVVAIGAALGVANLASAAPTPTPTPSAAATATPGAPDPGRGPGPGRGHDHARDGGPLAAELASKLGLDQAKVKAALEAVREANRPATKPTPGTTPAPRDPAAHDPAADDAALAKALAPKLGVDEAKVKTALDEIRAAHVADRAKALKTKLDAAVKAGTLTQAEADAVTKAVDKGVINVGPR